MKNWFTQFRRSPFVQTWMAPYYREGLYWLHSPNSRYFKLFMLTAWGLALGEVWLWHINKWSAVYVRKRMRAIKI